MPYYKDLREHLGALDSAGLLVRVRRPIDKDTELMPLVRWQFRGLEPDKRRAFLFEDVRDPKGRRYDFPVAVGVVAASRRIYGISMQCRPDEIVERWGHAQRNPISPVTVDTGPVKEVVRKSAELGAATTGFDAFPIPNSAPGYDNAPYLTQACWITKDPETGDYNIGCYRGQIKSPTRAGCFTHPTQHIGLHWRKAKQLGIPLEVAVAVGVPPNLVGVSVMKVPYGISEYGVAGGLAGTPIELVQAETVDLLVPAHAEVVFEGTIPTTHLEPEAPFGEYTGYMGHRTLSPFLELSCMTHRRDAIFQAMLAQHSPSEASTMSTLTKESALQRFLRESCGLPYVVDVAFQETGGSWQYIVVKIKKQNPAQPWQALNAVAAYDPAMGKVIVVVDDDVNPHDADNVNWAMSYRMQPERDVRIIGGKVSMLDPSLLRPGASKGLDDDVFGSSAMLIDATRPWDYPPVSLPGREFMERAREIWIGEGLPELTPSEPWHGYELGYWPEEWAREAQLAVDGDYFVTGEMAAAARVRIEDAGDAAEPWQ